jgi:PKD repeat protein
VATITSPVANVTINPGQSVVFSGAGSDPDGSISAYQWALPGGSPSASTIASPGDVTYSTPGTYAATLTVTDDRGLTSAAATRTVAVTNYAVSAAPVLQTVLPGAGTSFTATLVGGPDFTGTVDFSVSGLPLGASATFAPTSTVGSGTTVLTVSTSPATPTGTYVLTLRATSGPVVRSANVTLVVATAGDFTLAMTPTARTVSRGASTTFAATVAALQAFSGTVDLSVSGLPKFVTAAFSPASIAQSGVSVLTVSTKKQVKAGNYTLQITGVSGGTLVHSANVVLTVR